MKKDLEHYEGCLLGGAVGDALGAPVEFINYQQILSRYGPSGITEPLPGGSGLVEFTDDTQMTLFTAEGLLRSRVRGVTSNIGEVVKVVHHAYLRWLHTQGEDNPHYAMEYGFHTDDGYLIQKFELFKQRSPGSTCIAGLLSPTPGSMQAPLNNSKGCGAVMRAAPVGMIDMGFDTFDLSCQIAALTHGHQDGYLAAGAFSQIIKNLLSGAGMDDAVLQTIDAMKDRQQQGKCLAAMEKAMGLAYSSLPDVTCYQQLGQGWVADEALAIAVFCAVKHQNDFRQGVILAVNHNGDSDSTGSMTGNILGAYLGRSAIPTSWIQPLEMAGIIAELAGDLLTGFRDDQEWNSKYPGW